MLQVPSDIDWNTPPDAGELLDWNDPPPEGGFELNRPGEPVEWDAPPLDITEDEAISQWEAFLEKYENDPVGFAEDVLGLTLMRHQKRILNAIGQRKRRIAVKSGHRVGKTLTLAVASVWHIVCKYPQKTIITAPTSPQLFNSLFPEIMSLCKRLPDWIGHPKQGLLNYYTDQITLRADPDGSFLAARTADPTNPEGFQGIHSENILFIWDEASGIDERLFNAARGSMASPKACRVLAGNPTRLNNTFHKAFTVLKDIYETFTVSSLGLPTVDDDFVREVREEFGEDSNEFRIRVLGEFPDTDDESYISNVMVRAARKRPIFEPPLAPIIYGVDPAWKGGDRSVITRRVGLHFIRDQIIHRRKNTMQLVGEIVQLATEDHNKLVEQYKLYNRSLLSMPPVPALIVVDVIGIGAGVAERLAELGYNVLAINAAEADTEDPLCARKRDELWKYGKKFIEDPKSKIPDDEALQYELTAPHYEYTSGGVLTIEGKKAMKKRGLRSPDLADSFNLTMMTPDDIFASWGKDAAGQIGYGSGPKGALVRSGHRPTAR